MPVAVHFVQPAVDRVPLHVEDFVELALEVVEHGTQVEAVELFTALLAELLEEVAKALGAVAHWVPHAALHEVAHRVLQIAEVHQVFGQVFEDIVRIERRNFLGAVPEGIAVAVRHG